MMGRKRENVIGRMNGTCVLNCSVVMVDCRERERGGGGAVEEGDWYCNHVVGQWEYMTKFTIQ